MTITVHMPAPPSANSLFKTVQGGRRARTRAYDAWLEEANYAIREAARGASKLQPPLRLTIHAGVGRQRDISNLIKPIEDALVKSAPGLPDDRWNDDVRISRDPSLPQGTVMVLIESVAPG